MAPAYTIDTSTINDFLQPDRFYDREVFQSHWNYIDELCSSGEIISHVEVYEEILAGGVKEVIDWANQNKQMFFDYDLPMEERIVIAIGERDSFFLHQKKISANHADPWLIAQAKVRGLAIITSESQTNKHGIPVVASYFQVDTFNPVAFLKKKGFKV